MKLERKLSKKDKMEMSSSSWKVENMTAQRSSMAIRHTSRLTIKEKPLVSSPLCTMPQELLALSAKNLESFTNLIGLPSAKS